MFVETILQPLAVNLSRLFSRMPPWLSSFYINCISLFARKITSQYSSRRIQNSVTGHGFAWKTTEFGPRVAVVGRETEIMLHPHLGEFDEDILFRRRLDYEREVFEWLERNTAGRYDVVIEVGANVGVYTCFFQEIIRANPGGRLGKVFSFEPSREAFRRLQLNVMANRASDVELFNVAVGDRFGFIDFYEPTGHLTNGSIDKSFSALFSDEVKRATAVCVRPNSLERFAPSGTSSLLKIDVEGYEPQLLADMFDFVNASKPDILIEVLDVSVNLISQTKFLSQYDFYLISSSGLQRHDALFPDQTARDWLLVHKSRPL